MDQAVLVEQQQEEGKRLVEQLDKTGNSPSTAVWYYYADIDSWRLLLGGDHLSASRPEDSYRKIADALRQLDPPPRSISIADVKVVSETDPLLIALRAMIHTGNGINFIRLGDVFVNGFHIAQALAYRAA